MYKRQLLAIIIAVAVGAGAFFAFYKPTVTFDASPLTGNEMCIRDSFNSESFGFTGHLYVMLDSTYFVKRAVMNFPQKVNLNFVDYMKIEQNFDRAERCV